MISSSVAHESRLMSAAITSPFSRPVEHRNVSQLDKYRKKCTCRAGRQCRYLRRHSHRHSVIGRADFSPPGVVGACDGTIRTVRLGARSAGSRPIVTAFAGHLNAVTIHISAGQTQILTVTPVVTA